MPFQAYVVEDNKQLILEGQLHVALQTIGKEACSLSQKEVLHTHTLSHNDSLLLFSSFHVGALQTSFYKEYRVTSFSARDHCIFSVRLSKCILEQIIFCVYVF